MEIRFHFKEYGENRRKWFGVGEDHHRRVPVEMDGVEGLNTVGMWFQESGRYEENDRAMVQCSAIAPQLFYGNIEVGTKGRLWDGGFFADVEITEVMYENLRKDAQPGTAPDAFGAGEF